MYFSMKVELEHLKKKFFLIFIFNLNKNQMIRQPNLQPFLVTKKDKSINILFLYFFILFFFS